MSTVAKYGVSLRHSEETGLNGAEKALGPEHRELRTPHLGVWAPHDTQ